MTNPDPTSPPVFITLPEVMRMTSRSRSSVYEDPSFPLPISLTEPGRARRHVRWLRHEVEAWLAARIAERDAEAPQRRREMLLRREQRLHRRRTTPAKQVHAAAAQK